MTSAVLLATGAPVAEMDLLGALLRGAVSAAAVAALLLAAQRWGRDLAGLLAGLPTVTGPALVWLALDQGHDFAAHAAHGAVAAAVPCALFALGYAWRAPGGGRLAALGWGSVGCLAGLLLQSAWSGPLHLGLAAATLGCLACVGGMPRLPPQRPAQARPRPAAAGRGSALRAGLLTVLISGAVSALASLSAQAIGAQWAGLLTSPPLLAAAVVLELHRQGCPVRVQDFLRGYTAGLIGRSVFAAAFGALLLSQGPVWALGTAVAMALLLAWATLVWMRWRSGPGRLRGATP